MRSAAVFQCQSVSGWATMSARWRSHRGALASLVHPSAQRSQMARLTRAPSLALVLMMLPGCVIYTKEADSGLDEAPGGGWDGGSTPGGADGGSIDSGDPGIDTGDDTGGGDDGEAVLDADGDGFTVVDDCDDTNPAVNPAAVEICDDGLDNDCDGVADDGGVCVPCGNAAVAPLTAGETLYARTCGGVIEVALLGLTVGDALAILLGVDGESAPRFEVGLGTGADFAPFEASHAVGEAQALTFVVANETLTLRFVASSAAFSLATAVSGVDRFELNNGPSQAIDLGRLPFAGGASLETGDLDFYRLNPGRGNVLIVEATMLEFTAAFPRIWSGFSEASWPFSGDRGLVSQRTHFRADVPGQMSLGFRTPTGRDTTPIAFRVREWVPPACADDAGDPASGVQDDTVVAARALAGQVSATLCHGDYDVYTLGELDGGTLTLQLTGPNGLGFLLFRDGLQSIRYNSFSAEGGNRITLNVSDPGTYYVVVLGDTPEASGEYRLTSSR